VAKLALPAVAVLALLASAAVDRTRTGEALRIALRRFATILPPFVAMLSLASLVLTAISPERVSVWVSGEHLLASTGIAALIGSVALIPGFISFPLAGILLSKGVPYMVLAAFTVTLMLVGVATFPVERAYFGSAVAIVRNVVCFAIALLVALAIGLAFGELR
jgi:uncharacterized membrane protein YraQ (UPF0718 family)